MSEIVELSKSTARNIEIFIKSKLIPKIFVFFVIQTNTWVPDLEKKY